MPHRICSITRRAALGAIGAALVVPRSALAGGVTRIGGDIFGTTWTLTGASGADLAPLVPAIEALLAGIDRTFSPWRGDSTISRFNAASAALPCDDAALAHVTSRALSIARLSEGAFDPTVGPIVARWGFGPITNGGAPDWRGLAAEGTTIRKTRDDLTLDLCGIAKGYALDRAAGLVEASGTGAFLMEIGGEFVARGTHPDGRDWRVAIETPPGATVRGPVLRLPDGTAVATSGIGAQSYDLGGRTYGHIIGRGTQSPVDGSLHSVTVVSGDAATADGWATALCAAGPEAGPDLAHSYGIAAVFLMSRDSRVHPVETGPIREYLS
jgi:thiamine biosynthesis lipoprotein